MQSREFERLSLFERYQYLFYRIYVWQIDMCGAQSDPKLMGLIGSSLLLFVNCTTLAVVFKIITGYIFRFEEIYAVIGILLLYFINYFAFLYNNKSELIVAKFSEEGQTHRKRRTRWCLVYVIATLLTFVISVMILSPQSN